MKEKIILRLAVLTLVSALALLSFSARVLADTTDFSAAADSHVASGSPNANNGSDAAMDLNNTRDGVVRFDISAIPSGSTVTAATLTLTATAVGSATAVKNYGAHRILTDWAEDTVTWNTPGSTAGTNYATAPTETIAVSAVGSYNWNVSSDVTNFVNGSATNYGWRIIWSSNTSGTNKQVDFGAKENATAGNRPVLSVTYTPPAPADSTAPAAISDLALSDPSDSAITLAWTAPGDDENTGTATAYDIRYSTSNITNANWSVATPVSGEPTPQAAGASQSKTVSSLLAETTYYFAIKTSDEASNESDLSNVPSLATTGTPDATAPAAVADLAAANAAAASIELSWTAPGDDDSAGTAASYDIRYSTSEITAGNWSSATPVSGEPTPQAAGASQSMTVSGLTSETTYFFAIKTSDEAPNESDLSNVSSLATTAASTPPPPTPAPSAGSSSGGGGGTPVTVTFSGQAYPGGAIEVSRKSATEKLFQIIPTASASVKADGSFAISYTGLISGDYLYALRLKDKDGRITILSFDVNLLLQSSFALKDILPPPTIEPKSTILLRADDLQLTGYAAPDSVMEMEIDGSAQKGTALADKNGYYNLAANVGPLSVGAHYVRARQVSKDGKKSDWSATKAFKKSLLLALQADFNGDGKVNVTDWSVFLFRWASPDQKLRATADLDGSGKIDVIDLSIFLKTIQL